MNYKKVLLEIIKTNQPIGTHKLDRLFYSEADYSVDWASIIAQLKKEDLIFHDEQGFHITEKGLDFLGR